MVKFAERQAETLATHTFGHANTTRYHHIDAAIVRQAERPFYTQAVESLQRARVITLFTHGQHESLGGQCAAFVNRYTYICLGNLTRNGTEKACLLHEQLAQNTKQTKET